MINRKLAEVGGIVIKSKNFKGLAFWSYKEFLQVN